MKRTWLWATLGLMAVFALLPTFGNKAQATPVFARTYQMTCQTCHSGYPRLNSFGLAFKANNFRIPGAEDTAPLVWKKTFPLAVQVVRTSYRFHPGNQKVEFTDTQLLGGGLLTPKTAFYLHHSFWIDNAPVEFPSYEVWLQQVVDERSKLMLKAGQFELPYAYSPTTHLVSAFQPLPFGVAAQGNDVRLGSAMRGFELSGEVAERARWYAAYGAPSVLAPGNAGGQRHFFGEFHDLFLRVSNESLDRNFGGFVYLTDQARDPNNPSGRNHGYRAGLDTAYLWHGYQFYAMPVYGEDRDPLGTGKKGLVRAGLVEADRMFLPWLGLNLRWEAQSVSVAGRNTYADGKIIGLRLYPAAPIRLTAEYRQGDHDTNAAAFFASVAF